MNTEPFKAKSRFGNYGGCYVPEQLMNPILALEEAFLQYKNDQDFCSTLNYLLKEFAGRETPLFHAKQLQAAVNGPNVFLKREDLLLTGGCSINNALGQCLLAKKMGKTRVIAESGAGQHGLATATACAQLGLECVVYMGKIDRQRQHPNVEKLQLLGAKLITVQNGSKTLKDAMNEAFRDYIENHPTTHFCIGSTIGPYPFPQIVAHFQSIIGEETKRQCQEKFHQDPDMIIACIGGGSNAMGIFSAFLENKNVKLIGVEAGGKNERLGEHASRFQYGKPGVFHGSFSYLLQDDRGQIVKTHSISAGLDYPLVGPQHAELFESKRANYFAINDTEALEAFKLLSQTEGIIPALETAHAVAYYIKQAKTLDKNLNIVINLSGRGDKDCPQLFAMGEI